MAETVTTHDCIDGLNGAIGVYLKKQTYNTQEALLEALFGACIINEGTTGIRRTNPDFLALQRVYARAADLVSDSVLDEVGLPRSLGGCCRTRDTVPGELWRCVSR